MRTTVDQFSLLHWPNWFDIQEVKGDSESWINHFKDFVATNECPTFVKAQVSKPKHYAEHPYDGPGDLR